jgi:hypothetical protein
MRINRVEVRRAWRLVILGGTFFLLSHNGLEELQGEATLAAFLVIVGSLAICLGWSKVRDEPTEF